MALQYGYGQIAGAESLVFAYDAGDMRNSYIGKPGTNLLTSMSYSYGEQNSSLFKSHYGTEDVYIPRIGRTTAHFCEVYNDYSGGSGHCCPSLFNYGENIRTGVVGGAEYTYQIIYRTTTGYANPNYMYHYEYSDSGYITEYGLWSSSREVDLGDGWKHAWGTFTLNAATTRLYCYLFHYEYATYNKVQVAGVMLTQGNTVYRPHQFFPQNTSISSTGGLLDLTGNRTMNTTTVSHGTSAELQFDGTDDSIDLGTFPEILDNDYTVETVIKRDTTSIQHGIISDYQYAWWILKVTSANKAYVVHKWDNVTPVSITGTTTIGTDYTHITVTFSKGSGMKLYVNGNLDGSNSNTLPFILSGRGPRYVGHLREGAPGSPASYFDGEIPVVKLYTTALTASEVAQNFNHYKSRFNIS